MIKLRVADRTALYTADLPGRRVGVFALGILGFTVLTFVGANIVIPLRPVPITMQTLFVVLAGAILGGRAGVSSQILYLGVGVAGLPVFAGLSGGAAVLTGPTAGYLAGFVVAPLIVGSLISKARSLPAQFVIFYLGSQTILWLGVGVLSTFFVDDFGTALRVGYVPFIIGDLVKTAAAVSIYRTYKRLHRPSPPA